MEIFLLPLTVFEIAVTWTPSTDLQNERTTPMYKFAYNANVDRESTGTPNICTIFWQLFPLEIDELCKRINSHAKEVIPNWELVSCNDMMRWVALFMLTMEYMHGAKRDLWSESRDRFFPHPSLGW
jgi:hypothetical protein